MAYKVMVGMSGGVDSSASAALLQQAGHDVAGVTLRLFDNADITQTHTKGCCSIEDVDDARAVCAKIGIPFFVFDFGKDFNELVIQRFADEYEQGLTPNPCLDCNRYIKFDKMLERAVLSGYDHIATGHYAQVEQDSKTGRWLLKKAVDETKDQSYVLYTLSQEELEHLLLPLGKLHKTEVRLKAEELGLVNAHKPDSQDICFVPDGDYAGFLEKVKGITPKVGNFVNVDGAVLGKHKGVIHYTVGQRKGLGISAPDKLYVIEKNAKDNTVTLGFEQDLLTDTFKIKNCNWIMYETLEKPIQAMARTRYHQAEKPAKIVPLDDDTAMVYFETPQRRPAPGQAAVFYIDDYVLGGGCVV